MERKLYQHTNYILLRSTVATLSKPAWEVGWIDE